MKLKYSLSRRKPALALLAVLLSVSTGMAQVRVSGTVTDAATGEPLAGVWVHTESPLFGGISDATGHYAFVLNEAGTYRFHAEFTGYEQSIVKITVLKDTVIHFGLHYQTRTEELSQVVIHWKRSNLSGYGSDVSEATTRNRQQLEELAADNMIEALAGLPGIKTLNTGVGINKPVIHGLSGSRISVIEDGIRQEEQQWGGDHGVNLMNITTDVVSVYTGAATLIYGSGGSGGVVVMESGNMLKDSSRTGFAAAVEGRSVNNHLNYGFRYAQKIGKVTVGWYSEGATFGDYKVPAEQFNYLGYTLPITDGVLKNTAGRRLNNRLAFQWQSKKFEHHAYLSSFNQKTGFFTGAIGSPATYDLSPDGDYRNIDLPYQLSTHQKLLYRSEKNEGIRQVRIEVAGQYNLRKEMSRPHAHGRPADFDETLALDLKLMTWSANLRLAEVRKRFNFRYGIQTMYQENRMGGFEFLIPAYRWFEGGVYGMVSREINHLWVAEAGTRLDAVSFNSKEAVLPFYYRGEYIGDVLRSQNSNGQKINFAAKAGIKYEHGRWRSSLFASRSGRILNMAELASNGMHHGAFRFERGNTALKPESGLQLNWTVNRKSPRWELNAEMYYHYFFNFVYLAPSGRFATLETNGEIYPFPEPGQVYEYRQSPVLHYGGEGWLRYRILFNVFVEGGGDYVYLRNNENSQPLPFTPPASVFLKTKIYYNRSTGNRGFDHFRFEVTGRHVLSQNQVAINELPTPGYFLLRASMSMNYGKKWNVLVTGQNLLNRTYLSHLSRYRLINVPEPGRNIILKIRFTL